MSNIFDIFKRIEAEKKSAALSPITHIIVGLGNPGDKYANTRHNAGFMMMDYISEKCSAPVNRSKYHALVGEATIAGKRVLLMKPQTFMNLSGDAVREAATFYKIEPANIIVLTDDVNLDVGRMRVRKSGSDGGQKGWRSIIERMGSDNFPRIRIGVGAKPHPAYDLADWVLSKYKKEERPLMEEAFDKAAGAAKTVITSTIEDAMNKYSH